MTDTSEALDIQARKKGSLALNWFQTCSEALFVPSLMQHQLPGKLLEAFLKVKCARRASWTGTPFINPLPPL